MLPSLTEGAIEMMMSSGTDYKDPVLQVLGCKKVASTTNAIDRYRLLVSDGKYLNSFTMLSTQLAPLAANGDLPDFTIILIKKYTTSTINTNSDKEKRLLVILDLEIIKKGNEVGVRIGNPQNYDGTNMPNSSGQAPNPTPSPAARPAPPPPQDRPMPSYGNQIKSSPGPNSTIHPIASLNPYQNKWCIKARVTNKQNVRTYTNARGEGKLFSVMFTDDSGEIKCTGFNSGVDKFYDLLEVNKVYMVSNCSIKPANKKFTQADYEMTFNDDSQVVPCADDTSLPSTIYKFIPINKVAELETDTMVDVIGVAKHASDIQTLVSRNTGKELKKREVTLVDHSNASVSLTLWGQQAEEFDVTRDPVVAVKNGKLNEFMGGKSVSLTLNSTFEIDPDINEAHRLRGWYDNGGCNAEITSISAKAGAGAGGASNWVFLGDVASQGLGRSDKADYFSDVVNVLMVRSENCVYKACPTPECKKKILDMNNGSYRCEKCNRDFDHFVYRMLLSAQVTDYTNSHWVSLFHDEAQKLLGVDAKTIGEAMDNKDDSYKQYFTSVNFKKFQMKFRAKTESYNDETRLKITVVDVQPVDSKSYAKRLIDQIKQNAGISTVQ